MNRSHTRIYRWLPSLMLAAAAVFSSGAAVADSNHDHGRRLKVYRLLPAILTPEDAVREAAMFGLQPLGTPPAGTAPGGMVFGDAAGHVRGLFADGAVRFFPDLDPAALPPPSRGQALRMVWDFAGRLGLMRRGQPMLRVGDMTTLSDQGGEMQAGPPGTTGGGTLVIGPQHDVLRNIQLIRRLDGLDVLGKTSLLSFDVGAGGVVGGSIALRPIDPNGTPMNVINPDEATRRFLQEFPFPVTIGKNVDDDGDDDTSSGQGGATHAAAAGDQTSGRLLSRRLIYYEQGMEFLQPAYLFRVLLTGPGGLLTGHTWLVPAVANSPEPIINLLEPGTVQPIFASPDLVNPLPPICVQPPTIKYGRYLLRNDSNGWLVDTQGFRTNIENANAFIRGFVPSLPPVDDAQYFWNFPWLWEPTGSPATDFSPSFPGSVNVALIEGHGGQWIISTLSNCCDVIDLPKISGFGGFHSPSELTDYVIWQSCDVVPAPGDPYGFNFVSPATPFDVWFGMFQGMRGTYGYRTTMAIWNGVGAAFGGDLGIGAANLSAWFAECDNNVFHHGGGWNYGSAVLISGHEGDTLYDTCPLPPPGSLTIWWQHP